jgi:hypothetical protein
MSTMTRCRLALRTHRARSLKRVNPRTWNPFPTERTVRTRHDQDGDLVVETTWTCPLFLVSATRRRRRKVPGGTKPTELVTPAGTGTHRSAQLRDAIAVAPSTARGRRGGAVALGPAARGEVAQPARPAAGAGRVGDLGLHQCTEDPTEQLVQRRPLGRATGRPGRRQQPGPGGADPGGGAARPCGSARPTATGRRGRARGDAPGRRSSRSTSRTAPECVSPSTGPDGPLWADRGCGAAPTARPRR